MGTTLLANEARFIYPPRAQDAIPRTETAIFAQLGWMAQYKFNDSRCLVKRRSTGHIELWNRHGEQFRTYAAPDWLIQEFQYIFDKLGVSGWGLLDGGLLHQKHEAIKNTVVIWDILVHNGEHLVGSTYKERYDQLAAICTEDSWLYKHALHKPIDFGPKLSDNVFMPLNYSASDWDWLWENVELANSPYTDKRSGDIKPVLEGVVYKDPQGVLELGLREKNNSAWMVRSRVRTGRHAF